MRREIERRPRQGHDALSEARTSKGILAEHLQSASFLIAGAAGLWMTFSMHSVEVGIGVAIAYSGLLVGYALGLESQ